ncbi:hypothetical protein FHL15_009813 [Xylaria flabelliformis]|uniref:Uncharacterized protein n=1 Tax=Xylaria flabelliformis TaxID=2512241 RepID=A0A553HMQ3_9PEZI|nr:hypothetical protein FHL15_009813 [Xylaria flabelliformis]
MHRALVTGYPPELGRALQHDYAQHYAVEQNASRLYLCPGVLGEGREVGGVEMVWLAPDYTVLEPETFTRLSYRESPKSILMGIEADLRIVSKRDGYLEMAMFANNCQYFLRLIITRIVRHKSSVKGFTHEERNYLYDNDIVKVMVPEFVASPDRTLVAMGQDYRSFQMKTFGIFGENNPLIPIRIRRYVYSRGRGSADNQGYTGIVTEDLQAKAYVKSPRRQPLHTTTPDFKALSSTTVFAGRVVASELPTSHVVSKLIA